MSGSVALAGCGIVAWYGRVGFVLLAAGVVAVVLAIVRGRRPLVTLGPTTLTLRVAGRNDVSFNSIVRVDQTKTHDLELCLESGVKLAVPMALFEDDDATWLRKELRREVRAGNQRRSR